MLFSRSFISKFLATFFALNLFVLWTYIHNNKSTGDQETLLKFNQGVPNKGNSLNFANHITIKSDLSLPDPPQEFASPDGVAGTVSEVGTHAEIDASILIKAANHHLPKIRFEERVALFAKYYRQFRHEHDISVNNKKPLLCSMMISLTVQNIDALLPSIKQSDNMCDWLVIVYSVPPPDDKSISESRNKELLVTHFDSKVAPILSELHSKQSSTASEKERTKVILEFAIEHSELLTGINGLCEKYIRRPIPAGSPHSGQTNSKNSGSDADVDFLKSFDPCDMREFSLLSSSQSTTTADTALDSSTAAQTTTVEGNDKTTPYNHIIYPKISLFYSYLPYVSQYNYIWALDGDLSLNKVDMRRFFNSLLCSFDPAPLVMQPLIAESTQPYHFLNLNNWEELNKIQQAEHQRTIHSAAINFIEIQTPVFNSFFLEFFIAAFLTPMIQPVFILGADWGFDETFCKAAKYFAHTALLLGGEETERDPYVHCALLTSTAIHHKNSQETNAKVGTGNKFMLNGELVRLMSTSFPSFSAPGNSGASYSERGQRSHSFRPGCGVL